MSAITKYLSHLPTCNIKQDWTEAIAAFSDTPSRFRDQDWNEARQELDIKMQTCTCGLIDSMGELDQQSASLRQEVERLRGEKKYSRNDVIDWTEWLGEMGWYYVSSKRWEHDDEHGYFESTEALVNHYIDGLPNATTHHGKGGTEG